MKLFYDFEFTGLHKNTTAISLGVVADNGKQFYAEYSDFNRFQVDSWIEENVIKHLWLSNGDPLLEQLGDITVVNSHAGKITKEFRSWVSQFNKVEFWGDCSFYDGVLLNEALGGAFNLPENVDYIFYDICTLFKLHGIDPNVSREAFIDRPIEGAKHNALYDAKVIEACYEKLRRNRHRYPVVL